ncbi:hypothetical protein [Bacteroides reticulotermitis]|uniref:hypothetical protein n=1 Tax=Bacteroides reticulotermitis TaxID=1133319 RepID=UPI003A88BB54
MKKTQSILLLLLVVVFSSCYTTKITYKYMERIQRGMSPKEVKAILGEPTYRSFDDKGEILEFRSSEYGPAKTIKIRFVDDKVVEMQSYLDRYYDNNCGSGVKEVKEDKKKPESSEKDTSTQVRVTTDGKHVLKVGSIVVTPEGNHEVVVSENGGVIVTASGRHIPTF